MPRVTGTITTTDPSDTFATHDSIYGAGGLRTAADNTARNAIPLARKELGMVVYTLDSSKFWTLTTYPGTGVDADWTQGPTTKDYVDSVATGLSIKISVKLASIAALAANTYSNGTLGVGATLTATGNGALSIDSVAVTVADRVLVKDEAAPAHNGIYVVTAAGDGSNPYVLTRSTDMDQAAEVPGAFTFCASGSTNNGNGWVVASAGPFTIGTTAITFTQFTAAGALIAGGGLVKTGATLDVVAGSGISVAPDSVGVDFSTVQAKDPALDGLAALVTAGLVTYDGADGVNARTITAGSSKITVGNGSGVSGNPSVDVAEANLTLSNLGGTLGIAKGGSGQTTAAAAFDALAPTSSLGDLIYRNGSTNVRLPGNTTSQATVLMQTGTGSSSAAPVWSSTVPGVAKTFNVNDYGAVGDTKTVSDGVMSAASGTLTSATAVFAPGDVGKQIVTLGTSNRSSGSNAIGTSGSNTVLVGIFIPGDVGASITIAGAGVAGADLTTTISAFLGTDATNNQATLTVAASTTVLSAVVTFGSLTYTGQIISGSRTLTITNGSASINTEDIGTPIKIAGAGVAGADLVTTITGMNVNANGVTYNKSFTVAANLSTSVRGATITFGSVSGRGTITAYTSATAVTTSLSPTWAQTAGTFYWGTDDATAIQAAITAAPVGACVVFPSKMHLVNSPIAVGDGLTLMSSAKYGTSLVTGMSPSNHNGMLTISNKSHIKIAGIQFLAHGSSTAITTYGHDGLTIEDCYFTGSTTGDGIIQLDGQFGVAHMKNTTIRNCEFANITVTNRVVHVYPRSGHQVLNTRIEGCRFRSTFGVAVMLDVYDICRDTTVTGCKFDDLLGGTGAFEPGVAVLGGLANPYLLFGTTITNNQYRNTLNPNAQQGFAYIYCATGTIINDNSMVGAWTSNASSNVQGPAIAPGRIDNPIIGLTVQGNYIQGFNAPWDPDSMAYVDCSGNVVYKCRNSFALGYGIQRYVKIHDNVHYDSVNPDFQAGLQFDNSTPLKCEVYDNTYVDDRGIVAPTGIGASLSGGGSLTIGTPYYYVITSVDEVGETTVSAEVTKTPAVVNGSNQQGVRLTWPTVPGALSYNIYRSTTSGSYGATSLVVNVIPADYTDTGTTTITGTPPGISTVAPAVMTKAIELTGNFDFSDVLVRNNRFYAPHQTLTQLFLERGGEGIPSVLDNNEYHDSTGKSLPVYSHGLIAPALTSPSLVGGTASTSVLTSQATSNGFALLSSGKTVTGNAGTSVHGSALATLTDGVLTDDSQLQNSAPHSLTLDLGAINLISEFRAYLINPTDPPNAFPVTVLVSTDNVTFNQVGALALLNAGGGGWKTFNFTPTNARYVKLAIANTGQTFGPHFAEMEVYGYPGISASVLTSTAFGMGNLPTAGLDAPASTTAQASLRVRRGVAPTSPNSGDVYQDGTHLYAYINGVARQLDQQTTADATKAFAIAMAVAL